MPKQLNAARTGAGAGYIVGSGEGFNLIEYVNDGTTRGKLGRKDEKPLNKSIDDRIMTVDLTLGENDANKQVNHPSQNDRNYPVASGYAKSGVPTYGDGKVLTNTTIANDTSDDKNGGAYLNYMTQNGNVNKTYGSLPS